MLQDVFGNFLYFFTTLNQNIITTTELADRLGLSISLGSLIITILAIFMALGLYTKQRKVTAVKRMIAIISSFDLFYYNLEKHYLVWKIAKGESASPDALEFWKVINLTETVTALQELKTLSTVYSKRIINLEINSLLEFLGDIILISYRGEDLSDKDYLQENIICSDDFGIQMSSLIKKLSRGIGVKVQRIPEKEIVKSFIATHYLQ